MNGTLAWDISKCRDPYNCIDICPDTVYKENVRTQIDPSKIQLRFMIYFIGTSATDPPFFKIVGMVTEGTLLFPESI